MEYLLGRGLDEAAIEGAELGYAGSPEQGHEKAVGRIVIPYLATTGPVQLRFRAIDDETQPKYYGLPGESTRLFNARSIAEHPRSIRIYLCEGEMDTIVAERMLGLAPVVGIAGVQAWKPHYTQAIEGFEEVILLADNDEAGIKFADDMAGMLKEQDVRKVLMPNGHDLNSAFLEGGREHLLSWIRGDFA